MPDQHTFNWQAGTWNSGRPADAFICFAGDWAPIRDFKPLIDENPAALYGDLLPAMQACDLKVVNLEAPLSDHGTPACKSGAVFKGETAHVAGLTAVPFDVACLANNHMFDFGTDAFIATRDVLADNGVAFLGAGMNQAEAAAPLELEINGLKIGLVNFSEGEDLTAAGDGPGVMGWDLDRVKTTITDLKPRVDFLAVISHCGLEYIPYPPPYVATAFNELAGAGADLVIGHHPHVPQGISFPGGVPVCHSLGNFVFFQDTRLYYRKLGYMVKAGINQEGLASLEILPYRIGPQGLQRLAGRENKTFLDTFQEISSPLHREETLVQAWEGFLDHYGQEGFRSEISMILDKLASEPGKGAAMFRNRLTTLQHFHHFKDLMTRIMAGNLGTSPQWARDRAAQWLTRELPADNDQTGGAT